MREANELPSHFPWLDVLRGAAIVGVLVAHSYYYILPGFWIPWGESWRDLNQPQSWDWAVHFLPSEIGLHGVGLFFVISGFCIHWSFLKSGADRLQTGHFYWRRFCRIYPPYFLTLVCFILLKSEWEKPMAAWQIVSHVLFVHNWDVRTLHGINPSYWSLPIEFQLYLIYPLALVLLQRVGIAWGLGIAALVTVFFKYIMADLDALTPLNWADSPMSYWFFWLLGAAVARRRFHGRRFWTWPMWIVALPFALLILSPYWKTANQLHWWGSSIFFAWCVDRAVWSQKEMHSWRVLASLGIISYSLYLWHQPLLRLASHGFILAFGMEISPVTMMFWGMPLTILCLIALSTASYRWVEVPSASLGKLGIKKGR